MMVHQKYRRHDKRDLLGLGHMGLTIVNAIWYCKCIAILAINPTTRAVDDH